MSNQYDQYISPKDQRIIARILSEGHHTDGHLRAIVRLMKNNQATPPLISMVPSEMRRLYSILTPGARQLEPWQLRMKDPNKVGRGKFIRM